jgi:hypothetical protein
MEVVNWKDVEDVKIATFPYRGKPYDVKGIICIVYEKETI